MVHFTVGDVIKNSVILGSSLNSYFWIIRHMFVDSCLIYISNYIYCKYKNDKIKIPITVLLLLFSHTFFIDVVYLGNIFTLINKKIKEKNENVKVRVLL